MTSLLLAAPVLGACGGDDDSAPALTPVGKGDDGGEDREPDAAVIKPIEVDAGHDVPGDPPEELADEACAVDTNKVYDLISFDRPPEPTRLAVDLVNSRFAIPYLDDSKDCIDAVYFAQIEGETAKSKPSVSFALDPCSLIDRTAIEHNGTHWLLGTIDARKDARDIWVQEFDPESKTEFTAYNITKSPEAEREFALLTLTEAEEPTGVMAAWVEADPLGGSMHLKMRRLSLHGEPKADIAELDQPEDSTWNAIDGLAMAQFGDLFVALVYRRIDDTGHAELVLDVVTRDGERDRDAWVLTGEAGGYGTIDIASDDTGGAVIYSLAQGTSQQLWFQRLGLDGRAANVTSAVNEGGADEAVRIVGPPYKAVDASLAKLPNGYATSYRALPGGDVDSARIRVHFLDRFGRILDKSDVAFAEPQGGRTAIRAAYDGRVAVGWSDLDEDGKTTLTAIRLPCVGGL